MSSSKLVLHYRSLYKVGHFKRKKKLSKDIFEPKVAHQEYGRTIIETWYKEVGQL